MSKRSLKSGNTRLKGIRVMFILMLLFSYPLTLGLDFADVTLKNTDESDPMVDLGELIEIGGSHIPGDNEFITEKDETETVSSQETTTQETGRTETVKTPRTVTIEGRNITIDGQIISEIKTVVSRLKYYESNDIPVNLDTEYAELYTYLEVMDAVKESGVNVLDN
ncbi:MAG: hypothetical protein K6G12_03385 [Lachnospiraceae bacterium]|nr:hypothetical protein [Lachnospiraceae bacterium]